MAAREQEKSRPGLLLRAGGEPVHYGRLARLAMEVMEEKVKEAMEIFLNSR